MIEERKMTNEQIYICEQYATFVLDKSINRAQKEIDDLNEKLQKAVKKKSWDDFHSLAIKNIFELRRVIRTLEQTKENLRKTTSDYIESA
jgi:CRISPR/Cas system CSM-associated protein Csm2 small subunit